MGVENDPGRQNLNYETQVMLSAEEEGPLFRDVADSAGWRRRRLIRPTVGQTRPDRRKRHRAWMRGKS
ncbi:hypothetical protein ELZ82_01640 [Salmonella enterica subsp. enterica serovar Mikawasima]|nr:hypothetical protein ELZ80_01645 [Salmonella enterica subsp. enterica serovar Mikawasima]ECB3358304.1 hypothetical protein [Salmonella enterica subsp. enterica serovar Redba]AZT44779.1 hypothetical protein ELZ82_01640 [Salmonella enterica subsp. enterica serovar Mikawasima]HAB1023969.1 hypothetical protein [Salmonella enterica subsp. enterica serovar Mikawasima]HAB4443095.1 hypothetical protein [Salmonella enterica subsp. enterica serovar Mikawasima]